MRALARPWLRCQRLTSLPNRATIPQRRHLHLAPPFLLDDYIPRYMALSSVDSAKKRSRAYAHLSNCNLCPRLCGVNRYEKTGMCLIGDKAKVNVIAPHFGEGKGYALNPCSIFFTVVPTFHLPISIFTFIPISQVCIKLPASLI